MPDTATHTRAPTPTLQMRPQAAEQMRELLKAQGVPQAMMDSLQCAVLGRCTVIAQREGTELRWHLSISHPWRLPTWAEINAARDALIPPDVWLCQPMPPREFWINLDQHALHLWEVRDRELIAQWAYDGCGNEWRADEVARMATEGP